MGGGGQCEVGLYSLSSGRDIMGAAYPSCQMCRSARARREYRLVTIDSSMEALEEIWSGKEEEEEEQEWWW